MVEEPFADIAPDPGLSAEQAVVRELDRYIMAIDVSMSAEKACMVLGGIRAARDILLAITPPDEDSKVAQRLREEVRRKAYMTRRPKPTYEKGAVS